MPPIRDIPAFAEPVYVSKPVMPNLEDYVGGLTRVWESRWLSNSGNEHKKLEEQLLAYLQTPHLSIFNNGTTALTVAIHSLRLQGEVITTPFSFPATTHALAWNGIDPVFCDIDDSSMNIDPGRIEELITSRTTAILGVHVYGVPCEVEKIQAIADRHGLRVIYDAAHAFGVGIGETSIGNYGDISMFSFHPTKLFHSAEGGALTYRDENLRDRINLLRNFGIKNEHEVIMPGINGKMNELSALMGQHVLVLVDQEKAKRKKIREQYQSELKGVEGLRLQQRCSDVQTNDQYMVVRIDSDEFGVSRDKVYDVLREHNVYSRKYFYPLISDYPCYRQLATADPGNLPMAAKVSSQVLCLPCYGDLQCEDVSKICAIIKSSRD